MKILSTYIKRHLLAAFVLLALLLTPLSARAAEINPEPGTYSTGSTSEMSAYSTVTQDPSGGGSSNAGSLANTGQDAQRIMLLAVILLVVGGAAVGARYFVSRKKSA